MGVEGERAFKDNGLIQDDYRIEFIEDHLIELHRAIQEGRIVKDTCYGPLLIAGLG